MPSAVPLGLMAGEIKHDGRGSLDPGGLGRMTLISRGYDRRAFAI
jgi:hypothetical protein